MFVSLTKNINKKLSKLLIITSSHYQSLRKFRQFCFFPHNILKKIKLSGEVTCLEIFRTIWIFDKIRILQGIKKKYPKIKKIKNFYL